jgi:hypothetical protein
VDISKDWTPERRDLGGRPRSGVRRVIVDWVAHIRRGGDSRSEALVRPTRPVCAFHESAFVDRFWTEGFLASTWSRTQGTPPKMGLDLVTQPTGPS